MWLSIAWLSSIKRSFLAHRHDIRIAFLGGSGFDDPVQEVWGDVPTLSGFRDDGDRFPVVARENANDDRATLWLKRDSIPNFEVEHPFVRSRLMQKSQPFDDAVIEVDEFCLAEAVDVNSHCHIPFGGSDAAQRVLSERIFNLTGFGFGVNGRVGTPRKPVSRRD